MSLALKEDYVSEALGLLREAYQGRPNIAALLTGCVSHAQEMEQALHDLQGGLLLENATGATLDGYAALVGVSRQGLDDASLLLFVKAAIAANKGTATLQSVVSLAQSLFQTSAIFAKTTQSLGRSGGPTGGFISIGVGSAKLPQNLWPLAERLLAQNVAGGVVLNPLFFFDAASCVACAGDAAGTQPWAVGLPFQPATGAALASLTG